MIEDGEKGPDFRGTVYLSHYPICSLILESLFGSPVPAIVLTHSKYSKYLVNKLIGDNNLQIYGYRNKGESSIL